MNTNVFTPMRWVVPERGITQIRTSGVTHTWHDCTNTIKPRRRPIEQVRPVLYDWTLEEDAA